MFRSNTKYNLFTFFWFLSETKSKCWRRITNPRSLLLSVCPFHKWVNICYLYQRLANISIRSAGNNSLATCTKSNYTVPSSGWEQDLRTRELTHITQERWLRNFQLRTWVMGLIWLHWRLQDEMNHVSNTWGKKADRQIISISNNSWLLWLPKGSQLFFKPMILLTGNNIVWTRCCRFIG